MSESSEVVTVEEANTQRVYSTSNGGAPSRYASAEDLLASAPKDIVEEDVEDVFGGSVVRVRSLTAAQAARVRQMSFTMSGRSPEIAWAQMERAQFELGVIEPKLTQEQVLMLHRTSGASFAKVIETLDRISGTNKEELRKAQKEFQES